MAGGETTSAAGSNTAPRFAQAAPAASEPAAQFDPRVEAGTEVAPTQPRAGSNLRPKPTVAAASPTPTNEREALIAALSELQATGGLTPDEQAKLLEDLKYADPQLWPELIRYSRAAAERQQLAVQGVPGAATPAGGASPAPAIPPAVAATPSAMSPLGGAAAETGAPGESFDPKVAMTALPPAGEPRQGSLPPAVTAARLAAAHGSGLPSAGPPPSGGPGGLPASATGVGAAAAPPVQLAAGTATASPGSAAQPINVSLAAPSASGGASPTPGAATTPAPGAWPGGAAASTTWQAALDEAIGLREAALRASGTGATEREQAELRLLYLAAGRRDAALTPPAGLPAAQQAFWTQSLYALSEYLNSEATPDPGRRAAQALTAWNEAESQLSALGNLTVKNLAFCTEVKSYGITTPFAKNEFRPGQELLLYAELGNFLSEETPQGFHTAFRSSYELFDAQGRAIDKHEFALTEETCGNRRRDFFVRYFLQLPREQLAPGKHTLRLTVEDTLGKKIGQGSLDLVIVRGEP